jgi:serine-type D-Ala-D-Ala carboxypeptidase
MEASRTKARDYSRRTVVGLLAGGAVSLLGACVAAPQNPTAVPPATSAPQPTPAAPGAAQPPATAAPPPAVPTAAPPAVPTAAPTALPTAVPTSVPTATSVPTPTAIPTTEPVAETPPALAAAVESAMQRAIQRNWLPGGVVLVRHKGAQILLQAYGLSYKYDSRDQLSDTPISARTDTLYDLASISKLFTTTSVMRLVEQNRLALDEPVATWLPDFAAGGKAKVSLRQLLTHTSGLPDYLPLWSLEATPDARIQRVVSTAVITTPGTVYLYSDLGLIALGHLVEVLTGASLDRVVRDMVTSPLHLMDARYQPPAELKPRIAATEDERAVGRGMVWGKVHDENAWSLGGVAGHAGVFSTARDLGRFAQLYLEGGSLDGARLLHADTVVDMTRNQIPGIDWRGLGWELNQTYYMGHLASPVTYGHTGFTGTSLVIDPRRELIVVLLTNRVHPTRDGPSMNPTRQAVADAAMAAADAA